MWKNFENMMLSERSQTRKVPRGMIPFARDVQDRKIHGARKQLDGHQGLGTGGQGKGLLNGHRVFWGDRTVWELIKPGGHTAL